MRPAHNMAITDSASFQVNGNGMLGFGLDTWNNFLVVFLAVAATFALLAAIATYVVIQLQKEETAAARGEFERYKLGVESQVADAKKEGIEAGEKAGNALVRAAQLEKEAQELKASNLALEAKIKPRRLSGDDSLKLTDALSTLQPLSIGVVSPMLDPEAHDFANDLYNSFISARWPAARMKDWLTPRAGVYIATLEGTSIPNDLAAALISALEAVNIKAAIMTVPHTDEATIGAHFQPHGLYLLVGTKP
jgi:hypothetical protein